MFFFFIGGVQPRKKIVDDTPRRCPSCGNTTAYRKRSELYFSLFFIPLFPVKKSEPFLECDQCGYNGPEGEIQDRPDDRGAEVGEREIREKRCPSCGSYVPRQYRYCPHCGQRLRMKT